MSCEHHVLFRPRCSRRSVSRRPLYKRSGTALVRRRSGLGQPSEPAVQPSEPAESYNLHAFQQMAQDTLLQRTPEFRSHVAHCAGTGVNDWSSTSRTGWGKGTTCGKEPAPASRGALLSGMEAAAKNAACRVSEVAAKCLPRWQPSGSYAGALTAVSRLAGRFRLRVDAGGGVDSGSVDSGGVDSGIPWHGRAGTMEGM